MDTSQNADGEQLAASDLRHAQNLLINRQKGWKAMTRSLQTLVDRLQRERRYNDYLKLRINAPPSTPDIVTFLHTDKIDQLDLQLQDYLVGHPYLPTLRSLHQEQTRTATRPRALLLATMTLLGLRGMEDELSSDIRSLSSYVDRLGTQMLLSSPRDVHLVMSFELLVAHEPGLVGTAASQFEPEGRGLGLASENLLICAIRIARELGLDKSGVNARGNTAKLTHLSLWCCLRIWEALYAFFGKNIPTLEDLNIQLSEEMYTILNRVDDEGRALPSAPRLGDANGSVTNSFREMRDFCSELEKRLGRHGLLRSAGRTIVCLRLKSVCRLFCSIRTVKEMSLDSSLSLERKGERLSDIHATTVDGITAVQDETGEELGKLCRLNESAWRGNTCSPFF